MCALSDKVEDCIGKGFGIGGVWPQNARGAHRTATVEKGFS